MKALLSFTAIFLCLVVNAQEFSHTTGSFTDPRDGQVYQTITFSKPSGNATIKRTWFAENARFKVEDSYCYKDTEAYCEKFGRLYNYEAANKACPNGWHVPTIEEWNYLFDFFGGKHKAGKYLFEGEASDMHMLYGGFAEPGHIFKDISVSGNWWDNEQKGDNKAGIITLIKGSSEIYHLVIGNNHKLSTRCVKFHE
jgi:uncharacterized protein (TIGR02145 family)